jgi:tetratricopeptide (TPR) repeat protein
VALKKQVVKIVDKGYKVQQQSVAQLSDEQRASVGTYETWCAKDVVAHIAYWQEQRAIRLSAMARGEEPPPAAAHYEQDNAACFERFCESSWDEVQAFASRAHAQLAEAVGALKGKALAAPAPDAEGRPLWMQVVGTAYTHPLMHLAEQYAKQGRPQEAGQLWQEWATLVAPLAETDEWQGLVHYNTACGLALSGNPEQAIGELRQALELRPGLTTWSRHDPDLASLHAMPEYRGLYAPEYWWKAIEAGPQSEALADQSMRCLGMLRQAVKAFPAEEWRKGNTLYQRPAGLAVHVLESTHGYSAMTPGEYAEGMGVEWEDKDSAKLPSQENVLAYLEQVEEAVAGFLARADLSAAEGLFPWTGATLLSRAGYMLRHVQHHVAEMCLELHRRGLQAPRWQ